MLNHGSGSLPKRIKVRGGKTPSWGQEKNPQRLALKTNPAHSLLEQTVKHLMPQGPVENSGTIR